jgi:hypothetical protein
MIVENFIKIDNRELSPRQWEKRLLAKRKRQDGHWLWTGAISKQGHGYIGVSRTATTVHRVAWEIWQGPIPDGYHVHHTCERKDCFNPKHLKVMTPHEHFRFHLAGKRMEKCRRGHRRTTENTYVRPNGAWECKDCRREMNNYR